MSSEARGDEPTRSEGWTLTHWTIDGRDEIGSMPAYRVESEIYQRFDHDPLEKLRAEVEKLRAERDEWKALANPPTIQLTPWGGLTYEQRNR